MIRTGSLGGVGMDTSKALDVTLRGVLEAAPDAMVISDLEGRIRLVNSRTELLFGYERFELRGKSVEVLLPPRYRGEHPFQRALASAAPLPRTKTATLDLFGLRKDGTEFSAEISLTLVET